MKVTLKSEGNAELFFSDDQADVGLEEGKVFIMTKDGYGGTYDLEDLKKVIGLMQ